MQGKDDYLKTANKSLHLTANPLRSIAAGELGRYGHKLIGKFQD